MTETPKEAFLRVRQERGDKWAYLASLVGITNGAAVNSVHTGRVPRRWLPLLPAEYREAVAPARVVQLRKRKIEKLRETIRCRQDEIDWLRARISVLERMGPHDYPSKAKPGLASSRGVGSNSEILGGV